MKRSRKYDTISQYMQLIKQQEYRSGKRLSKQTLKALLRELLTETGRPERAFTKTASYDASQLDVIKQHVIKTALNKANLD